MAWTAAAAGTILALGPTSYDWAAAAVMAVLTLIGIALFLPQLILGRTLDHIRRHRVDELIERFRSADRDGRDEVETRLRGALSDSTSFLPVAVRYGQVLLPAGSFVAKILLPYG
jgi:hypothetical protein